MSAIQFIIDYWPQITLIIAALIRLIPTEKNYDVASKILRLLDLIIPNLKKGGGRHVARLILFFALAFVSVQSFAQLNTRTRQIRFATGVQFAADTAETSANAGRIWYDFLTDRYRANEGGVNGFLGGSGGGAFWPLTGSADFTGPVTLNGTAGENLTIDSREPGTGFSSLEMEPGIYQLSTSSSLMANTPTTFISQSGDAVLLSADNTAVTSSTLTVDASAGNTLTAPGASYVQSHTAGTFTGPHTFTPTATRAGFNPGSGSTISSPVNGDIWYHNTRNETVTYVNSQRVVSVVPYKYMAALTFNFPNTAAGAQSTTSVSFGAGPVALTCNPGDPVIVSTTAAPPNGIFIGRVSATNEVTITYINTSTVAVDPASLTFNYMVLNYSSSW
jgi:hypothetical protein